MTHLRLLPLHENDTSTAIFAVATSFRPRVCGVYLRAQVPSTNMEEAEFMTHTETSPMVLGKCHGVHSHWSRHLPGSFSPWSCALAWIGSFGRSFSWKWEGRCDILRPWGKRWMAECVRLSLVDIDQGLEFPWGGNKGRWCLGSHEESVVCYPVHLSFFLPPSLALGPGTEGCLWKVMEIRWNVVLLWR